MRVGLLTDSGYPYAPGGSGLRCDRGRFAAGRRRLGDLAGERAAVRPPVASCRTPGARRSAHATPVLDLRRAASGGSTAPRGPLAKRFFGASPLVTGDGVRPHGCCQVTGRAPWAGEPGGVGDAPVCANAASPGAYAGAGERDV
ncbi:hypothetical protein ACFU76_38710 [Streptomyces sp. NPDC057539]|uniref:hypothetical protein n=1 Tax=Streptomyces sp. NPDC057539 TaxID=3346159 RepID=UPI0036AC2452